jgi:CAAX prenyl protease-like protein
LLNYIRGLVSRHPSWPYVVPFATFVVFLGASPWLPAGPEVTYPLRVVAVGATLVLWSSGVVSFRVSQSVASVIFGVAVFLVWIAPDLLWPGFRAHWLFQNAITGELASSVPERLRGDAVFLAWRCAGAAILVPFIEEVFWRGWLMRWVIERDFGKIALGTYQARAFWICALMFAAEHGPYWDVGLVAGVAFNWWMVRTRSLGDCILAHAVTNACLAAYVLIFGHWEYLL